MKHDRYDEIGKIKEVSQTTIIKSIGLIREGRVFDLGMEVNKYLPGKKVGVFPTSMLFESTPEDTGRTLKNMEKDSKVASTNEVIISSTHISTHIDALCHSIYDGKVIGKHKVEDIRSKDGWKKFGVETIPPIIGRGILIDIAKHLGRQKLDDGHVVSLAEVKSYIKDKEIKLGFGDIICVRTGKIQDFWDEDYFLKGPGMGPEAAGWLAENGMCVLCVDYNSVDPLPWKDFNNTVHVQMIYKNSIYLIEALNLEELSKENIVEFFFICSAPKFTGCSGIWVRPVAVI